MDMALQVCVGRVAYASCTVPSCALILVTQGAAVANSPFQARLLKVGAHRHRTSTLCCLARVLRVSSSGGR
jgi:hypothetical protein